MVRRGSMGDDPRIEELRSMLDEVLEVVASSAVHAHEEARAAARLALRAEASVADVQGEVDRLDAHVEALTRALREYLRAEEAPR